MNIDWSRARVQKTTDAKGRKIERAVYDGENRTCSQCVHYSKSETSRKTHHYCDLFPANELRDFSIACVLLEIKSSK